MKKIKIRLGKWRIATSFKWYDVWVGCFYDRNNNTYYVCLIPCFVIIIQDTTKVIYI